jgi:hypothetical protein
MSPPLPMPPPVWGAPDGIGVADADVTTAGGVGLGVGDTVTVTTTLGVVVVGTGDGACEGVVGGLGAWGAGGVVAVLVQGGVGLG